MGKVIRPPGWKKNKPRGKGYRTQMAEFQERQRMAAELTAQVEAAQASGNYVLAEELARRLETLSIQEKVAGVRKARQSILAAMFEQLREAQEGLATARGLTAFVQSELNSLGRALTEANQVRNDLDHLSNAEITEKAEAMLATPQTPESQRLQAEIRAHLERSRTQSKGDTND